MKNFKITMNGAPFTTEYVVVGRFAKKLTYASIHKYFITFEFYDGFPTEPCVGRDIVAGNANEPIIVCDDYDTLLKAKQIAWARGLNWFALFNGLSVRLTLRRFTVDRPDGTAQHGFGVTHVYVNARDLLDAAEDAGAHNE